MGVSFSSVCHASISCVAGRAPLQVTSAEIDEMRERYRPAAKRGAVLFFVMAGLSEISNMYEYSLASYLQVFNNTLATSKKDSILESRLGNIIEALTSDVYNYTCLGLFERHKLMFSFQMTLKILDADGALDRAQLDFFLKGNLSLEKSSRKRPFAWIPEQVCLAHKAQAFPVAKGRQMEGPFGPSIWKGASCQRSLCFFPARGLG